MLQHALAPATNTPVAASASYGALMDDMTGRVHEALSRPTEQIRSKGVVEELAGYEHFALRAADHLLLLSTFTGDAAYQVRRFAHRLGRFAPPPPSPSPWTEATRRLGAAHDVLASHFHAGEPRTPEAEELLETHAGIPASTTLTGLLVEAASAAGVLIERSRERERRSGRLLLAPQERRRLRAFNAVVGLHGKAAMWELSRQTDGVSGRALEELSVAATPTSVLTVMDPLQRSLAALQLLRRVSFDQARGIASASPQSLRDLAALGTAVTNPQLAVGDKGSALGRVRTAQALDVLDAAHRSWSVAGDDLASKVMGVTKAPRAYRLAVDLVTAGDAPELRAAVVSALPRLGEEAAHTVEAMARNGMLLTRQPVYCQPRQSWQPITDEEARQTAHHFAEAGEASRSLAVVLSGLRAGSPRDGTPETLEPRRHVARAAGTARRRLP